MYQTKVHNHPIFVLTLAVYLGLVLAGGASPALAQAAMAKSFDLQVEQEFKDDLDKKPDDVEEELPILLDEYFKDSVSFLQVLRELGQQRKFNLDSDKFSVSKESYVFCDEDSNDASFGFGKTELEVLLALKLHGSDRLADCTFNSQYYEFRKTAHTNFKISYDKLFLKIEIAAKKQSQQNAQKLVSLLAGLLSKGQRTANPPNAKLLSENTNVFSQNDQVFVVTNLPRAGLEALLAAK